MASDNSVLGPNMIKILIKLLAAIMACLTLAGCVNKLTDQEKIGYFILTTVMRFDPLGTSNLDYQEICRADRKFCIGSNELIRYEKDIDAGFMLYANKEGTQHHIVSIESGKVYDCEANYLIEDQLPNRWRAYWLDKSIMIFIGATGSGPNKVSRGYITYLRETPCKTKPLFSMPQVDIGSDSEAHSPDRKGIAWRACTSRSDCKFLWIYDDETLHEMDIGCAEENWIIPYWVGNRPEPRTGGGGRITEESCLNEKGELKYPTIPPKS